MELSARYSEARRITLFGAAKNIILSFSKILFGITGHSHALFADGIHSLSDLVIDTLVLIASRVGSKAADTEHPYGHGRIETAATMLLALLMSLAGFGIIIDAAIEIVGNRISTPPNFYVLLVALFSVILNEVLYFYTRHVGEKIQSNLLVANAWHHRSDSASSFVVLIGAGGAWFGFGLLDPIAAAIVGVMIVRMAWQFGWNSIRELVDTGLDEKMLTNIMQKINKVPGVRAIHQLRTRSAAGKIFLDMHILVDPMISVSEGHFIGQQVHFCLLKEVKGITDVTVHVDPEDDEIMAPSKDLPGRGNLITLLKERWSKLIEEKWLDNAMLHYLNGKVIIELRLPLKILEEDRLIWQQLTAHLKKAVADLPYIGGIELLFCEQS